mgnify:CR=1 FL=1
MERLATAISQLVERGAAGLYVALYPALVLRDHGDHHVDVRPLNQRMPAMVRVPYCVPFPGARCRVKPGGVALVAFEEGDPSRPLVVAWERSELEFLRLEAGAAVIELDAASGEVRINP